MFVVLRLHKDITFIKKGYCDFVSVHLTPEEAEAEIAKLQTDGSTYRYMHFEEWFSVPLQD